MEERECRVCRDGSDDDHPLYAPCLCNGSILYCHQDCLEEWLKHSGKDKCELCGTTYTFSPKYSPDMPDTIPMDRIISGSVAAFCKQVIPFIFRLGMALVCWLFVVPYATSVIYGWLMSTKVPGTYTKYDGVVTGVLLTGLIALTFIILMSFADFLRAYWANHPRRHRHRPALAVPAWGNRDAPPGIRLRQGGVRQVAAAAEFAAINDIQGQQQPQHLQQNMVHPPQPAVVADLRPNLIDIDRVLRDEGIDVNHAHLQAAAGAARAPGIRNAGVDQIVHDIRDHFDNHDGNDYNHHDHHHQQHDQQQQSAAVDLSCEDDYNADEDALNRLESEVNARHHGHLDDGNFDTHTARDHGEGLDTGTRDGFGLVTTATVGAPCVAGGDAAGDDTGDICSADAIDDADVEAIARDGAGEEGESDSDDDEMPLLQAEQDDEYGDEEDEDDLLGDGMFDDNFLDDGFDLAEEELNALNGGGGGGFPVGDGEGNGEVGIDDNRDHDGPNRGNGNDEAGGVEFGGRRRRRVVRPEVEVHLNLAEILGLRGPLFTVCRYACWVLVFNFCCMFVGIILPSMVGSFVLFAGQPLVGYVDFLLSPLLTHPQMPPLIPSMIKRILCPTNESKLLRLDELLEAAVGYLFAGVLIIFANLCRLALRKWTNFETYASTQQALALALTVVGALGEILKIGVMLGFRIFSLPCIIGSLVMLFCNIIFAYPLLDAAEWAGNNIIGAVAVLWGAGIAYMLFATITILQLREILHPDILARYIRPQESQSDLLSSLLNDPALTQIKRLFASFGVYLCISLVFIYLPIQLFGYLWPSIFPVRMYFCYFATEAQVPFEVGFLHTVYLMMLEKYKDLIGYALHYGLLHLSKMFGVDRFLMPYSMKIVQSPEQRQRALRRKREIISLPQDGGSGAHDSDKEAVIGQPMFRPPKGWDSRTRKTASRWSWSPNEITPLEASVAPRITPTGYLWRIFAVACITWLAIVTSVTLLIIIPLVLGRSLLYLLMIPSDYWHDPLCVFIGVMASQAFVRLLKVSGIFLNVLMANYMMFEDRTWLLGARIGMNLVVLLPFSLGLFYTLLVRYPSQFLAESLDDVVTWQEALRCYLLGLIAVLWIAVLVLSGAFDRILAKVGASKMFEDVNMALLVIVEGVNAGRWRMGPQQAEDDTVDGEERDVDSSFFYMSLVAIERMLVLTSIKQFILFIMLILLCVIVEAKVFRGPSVMTCLPVPAVHHMFWAHAVAYSGTLYMICKTLGAPLSAWLDIFYRSIKDENYLIGMELQNSQEVV